MSTTPKLEVKLLRAGAVAPAYQSAGAAGLDLVAAPETGTPIKIGAGGRVLVPTGIAIALPPGHEGQVRPRSGLAAKQGVTCLNAPGTIDEDYRGEVQVLLVNHGEAEVTIQPGDRIAQLVVAPVVRVDVAVVPSLSETARGAGGFGSTGGTC